MQHMIRKVADGGIGEVFLGRYQVLLAVTCCPYYSLFFSLCSSKNCKVLQAFFLSHMKPAVRERPTGIALLQDIGSHACLYLSWVHLQPKQSLTCLGMMLWLGRWTELNIRAAGTGDRCGR